LDRQDFFGDAVFLQVGVGTMSFSNDLMAASESPTGEDVESDIASLNETHDEAEDRVLDASDVPVDRRDSTDACDDDDDKLEEQGLSIGVEYSSARSSSVWFLSGRISGFWRSESASLLTVVT